MGKPIFDPSRRFVADRWQIRFGGTGGQGVVVLGDTLSLAGTLAGWNAAAAMSYGAQVRGGASSADVILSPEPIDYPHVERPDVLLILSQEAYDAYTKGHEPPGLVLLDSFVVVPRELAGDVPQLAINATQIALDRLNDRQGANFIMLGALLGATCVLAPEAIDVAIRKKMNRRFWDLNEQALRIGYETIHA